MRWHNEYSQTFLERDYLLPGQTVEDRLSIIALRAEYLLGIEGFAEKWLGYMAKGWYSLSTPIWTNFGVDRGLPISCFNSHINDDMESILYAHSEVGMMTKYGGGTSAYFGDLRSRGTAIKDNGQSSGAVHFMNLFESLINIVSQGKTRRGSFAAYLPIEHPDAREFLTIRNEGSPLQNISFGITVSDEWLHSMIAGDVDKRELWAKVLEARASTGYPYIMFSDNVNNNAPDVYKDKGMKINSSNLCVTGDQLAVTSKGLRRVRELYESGEDLILFDGEKEVSASPMELKFRNVPVYRITTVSGRTHRCTADHRIKTIHGMVRCDNLSIGDLAAICTTRGPLGDDRDPDIAMEHGMNMVVADWLFTADERTMEVYIKSLGEFYKGLRKQELQIVLSNFGIGSVIDGDTLWIGENESYEEIVSIEPDGEEDVFCTTVNSPEHVWVCNSFITSNCSEITLYSGPDESFVCDLSSMNILYFDEWKDTDAVETLVFFLDAVMSDFIERVKDIPFMERTYNFATRQRALGLGWLGWHSYLQSKGISFQSTEAKLHNSMIARLIQDKAWNASFDLAQRYGEPELLEGYGRRNVTLTAIAPTKSSSFILGQVSEGIEPYRSNYYIQDLAKGKFTLKNPYLFQVLGDHGQNTDKVWDSIIRREGSVQHLDFLTDSERAVFMTMAEISPKEMIIQASARQKYIDQAQSLNLMIHPKIPVKDVNRLVLDAWELGVKTLYYQISLNAAQEFAKDILNCESCQ